ncbi:MAG: phytanoyl-CoA dioxygenase family protein [Candidatus Poribacteria bacterium]|nr:phytanoyl-CoA dioxygenase family protein [Candidatus Poribacteria bacterium]
MTTSPILAGKPFSEEKTQQIVQHFYRDGFVHIPGVLTPEEVSALRDKTDELFADPDLAERTNPELADTRYIQLGQHEASGQELPFILRNTIEVDRIFRDMLLREPILSLAEGVVGTDCKFCGQNVLRNLPGLSIDRWHVDGQVHFPLPDNVPRHDPRIRMPVMWFTVQMALTDIESIEQGPTQYVPGSHYSGRNPNDQANPEFEGRGPISVFCKAGDIYLQDPQCWHRGAPNRSNRTRYILQSQYAARWAYWRFSLCNRVPVPDNALQTASDRLLNLLGRSRPNSSHTI